MLSEKDKEFVSHRVINKRAMTEAVDKFLKAQMLCKVNCGLNREAGLGGDNLESINSDPWQLAIIYRDRLIKVIEELKHDVLQMEADLKLISKVISRIEGRNG